MDDLTRNQQQTLENTLLSLKEAVEWQLKSAQEGSQPVVLDQQSFGRVSRIDAIQQQQMAVAGRQELQVLESGSWMALMHLDPAG